MSDSAADTRTNPVTAEKPANPRWGVILLGHGSQRGASPRECSCAWKTTAEDGEASRWPEWCRQCPSTPNGLADMSGRLQRELGDSRAQVLLSCLEFIEPFPPEAVRLLSGQGLDDVVIMPYLLGHGKHATLELDEMLDELRRQLPLVRLRVADGLGADPRLAELVTERIRGMGAAVPAPAPGQKVGVLLVKAGTRTQYDDCLWLAELGRIVENNLGLGYAVAVAQSHYGEPTMEFAAARLVQEQGVSAIICVPYIFFPGLILTRNVLGALNRLEEAYPTVPVSIVPPLGVDDRLAAVAADRIRAARNLTEPTA